jgi:hypothetical protein
MTSVLPRSAKLSRLLVVAAGLGLSTLIAAPASAARVLVTADGPDGMATYDILGQHFSIETPDCGHKVPHVTEAYDDVLKKNVFVFHLHVKEALDDDRCGAKDRQRTEIRGKGDDVVANKGETVYYHWKFKLPAGFQTSPNFCHIMQIKSNDGAPIMTLTPRTTNIAMDGRLGAHGATPLAPFLDQWVAASMKVLHDDNGTVQLVIRRIPDGAMMFSYSGTGDTWDDNTPQDPKWGIYRSLNSVGDLRDEEVRFADFCISKTSAAECEDGAAPPSDASVGPPPSADGGVTPPPGRQDGAAPPPTTPPPPEVDASVPTTPPPSGQPTPPPGPVVKPPGKGGGGGCSCTLVGARPGAGAALTGLLVAALVLRRRRGP